MTYTPEAWAAFLRAGAKAADDDVKAVLKKGAVNVKKDWVSGAKASSGTHASAYPYSITFDEPQGGVGFDGGTLVIEIGPDPGRKQGIFGWLLEYGSVNNGPQGHGKAAADAEEPRLAEQLAKVALSRW